MDAQGAVRTVTPDRWARLKDLFDQALAVDERERHGFVCAACGDDTGLKRSLTTLLNHHDLSASGLTGSLMTPERVAEIILADLRAFVPGEVVANRFRVDRFLAEGGMGEVYAAEDLELGDPVALKTIRPELARDERILARFKLEIQLARKVTHRNVSRVFDLFRHEVDLDHEPRTVVFLSMELLQGETLAARIRRSGPLRPAEAQKIAVQLIAGLEAAHHAGIIHRDFKSGNVVLVPEPDAQPAGGERVVIMDFGLASTLKNPAFGVAAGGLTGTPAYMAPEQVENGPITPATDVYALGVVLFEMAAGAVPFRGASPMETAHLRLRQDAPSLRSVAPAAPAAWDRTIRACLQRNPAARPASAREVEALLTGRYERQRRARALATGVALAFALGGGWYWAHLPHRPTADAQAAADSARVKLENITKSGFLDAIADYRRAIQLDPQWAQPWAELAYAYAAGANAQQIPATTARTEARMAALQAIRLDGRSAKAFGALGWVQSLDFDEWPHAEANFRQALALNPGDGQVHYWLGVHLRKKGRFADAEVEDRQALDLVHKVEPSYWCELAFLYWTNDRLDLMDAFMKELLVAHPNFGFTRFLHARLLKEHGRFDDALAELGFSERLQYSPVTVLAERASIEAYRGNVPAARVHLLELTETARQQPVDTLLIAGAYAKIRDFDAAFAWLERGYAQRDSTLLSIATSPVLKPLRTDPRFVALCRRLHIES